MDEAMKVGDFRINEHFDSLIVFTLKVLENKPSSTFWTVLARTLEKYCKDASRSMSPGFLPTTTEASYLDFDLSRFHFYATDSELGLPSPAAPLPRIFRENRRSD